MFNCIYVNYLFHSCSYYSNIYLRMSNIFSFLIATDCHLGYEETDHIIGDDSFVTFEEILIKAVEEEVDVILLGGDLFHHNNPSQKCMHRCMELLRRYTLGDRPVYFELLSNAAEVFQSSLSQTTNYLDDNINVSIPVFSIHGNHDDPSGLGQACALDTLSSAGLINYFGKWTNLQEVEIKPILLRKGKTKIALYGLSHIKDDRLCRLFIDNKVKFVRPENEPNKWFNIFVLHQNRVDRGPKRFISESHIPDFVDLVIWGHEHDCEIEPVQNLEKGFYVIQPGSSVPTSLCEGESIEKHVAVLKVYEKKMKIKPLKLNTTRPFIWRSVNLWDVDVGEGYNKKEKKCEEIKEQCQVLVEEMILEAKKLLTGHIKQPKLPLVRLRCLYDDESQLFNIVKFGQAFDGRVANPFGDIIRLKRSYTKVASKKPKSEDLIRLSELYKQDMEDAGNFTACVNHIVQDYFTNHEEAKMLLLRVGEMGTAVEKFVEKDDMFAVEELVDRRFEKTFKELIDQKVNVDETDLKELFEQQRKEYERMDFKEEKDLEMKLSEVATRQKKDGNGHRDISESDNEDQEMDDLSEPEFFAKDSDEGKERHVISDSGTDEYDVDNEFDVSSTKTNAKKKGESRGFDTFRREKPSSEDESTSKTRGRGRGRGSRGGRGRGSRGGSESGRGRTNAESSSSRKSPRSNQSTLRERGRPKQPLKFQNSLVFESDSD